MQRLALLLATLGVVSCLPDVAVNDPTVQLTCANDDECPEDFICRELEGEGRCIALSVISKDAILLVDALTVVTPRVAATTGHDVITATFSLSEVAAFLEVEVDDQPLTCATTGAGPVAYTCTLTVSDAVAEGVRTMTLKGRDAAGTTVNDTATVVVDRRGPALLRADVLAALPGQTLTVGLGGEVTISLIFDEAVAAATVDVGGTTCADLVVDGARAICTVTIVDSTEGPKTAVVTAADDLDNGASVTTDALFVVDVTAPEPPTTLVPGAVVYERIPWGAGDSDRARFTLTASADAVEAGADVAVFADLAGTLLVAQGPPGTIDLGGVDRARAYVAAVDAAGNRSTVLPVREQRWIASLGNKVGTRRFENPHQVFAVASVGDRLLQPDDEEVVNVAGLDPGNAGSVVAAARVRATLVEGALPPDRADGCLAFDRARGEVVLFGGKDLADTLDDTWIFADGRWREASPATSPPPRHQAGCGWDPLRDRVVMVGGASETGLPLDEIWEWDGVTWARSGQSLPVAVIDTAVAFDANRLAVIALGGVVDGAVGDTAFAITADAVVTLDGPRPSARRGAGLVDVDDGLVVFGGVGALGDSDHLGDTWRLEGTGFRQVTATAPAANVEDPVIAALDGSVYAQLGAAGSTFRLDEVAGAWVAVSVGTTLGARLGHRAVGRDDDIVIVGGSRNDATTAQRLVIDDAGAGRFAVVNDARLPLTSAPLAFDPVTGSIVAIAADRAVFLDDGSSVVRVGAASVGTLVDAGLTAGPLFRPLIVADDGAVAAFDGRDFVPAGVAAIVPPGPTTRAVRVGDDVVLVNASETWRLSGGVWQQVLGENPDVTTVAFSLAALGGRVFAIGDDDVATLDDGVWTTTTMVGPPARVNTALVTDPDSGRIFMAGGFGSSSLDDLWSFDGTTFVEVTAPGPAARFGHFMAWDRVHREIVLGAGIGSDEVWRIDTAGAARPALRLAVSVGASQVPVGELREIAVTASGAVGPTLVWNQGAFSPLASTTVSRSLLAGDEATLQLVFPASGTGADATATLDAVDVAFTFRSN